MFGRQRGHATGWFHFRNGQHSDSSRQSLKADLNLSAHLSNIVYDPMAGVQAGQLFICGAATGITQVFLTGTLLYFRCMSASWKSSSGFPVCSATKFFWFSYTAVSSFIVTVGFTAKDQKNHGSELLLKSPKNQFPVLGASERTARHRWACVAWRRGKIEKGAQGGGRISVLGGFQNPAAPSSLIWLQCWPCFEEGTGLDASQGPLTCGVLWWYGKKTQMRKIWRRLKGTTCVDV